MTGAAVRRAFEGVFRAMVGVLERSLPRDRARRAETARSIAALCVGGMVVARGLANRESADGLRDACMQVALDLGGWRRANARNSSRRNSYRRA
jgi:hypothetical protein